MNPPLEQCTIISYIPTLIQVFTEGMDGAYNDQNRSLTLSFIEY